jgi:hypothetical protein
LRFWQGAYVAGAASAKGVHQRCLVWRTTGDVAATFSGAG